MSSPQIRNATVGIGPRVSDHPDTPLTDRQEAFCREYLVDFSVTEAARRAGYSEKSVRQLGSQVMRLPKIQAYLRKILIERMERIDISADWVVQKQAMLVEMCMTGVPVLDKDGKATETKRLDLTEANRGLMNLAKMLGMKLGTFDVNHSGKVTHAFDLSRLSDDELTQYNDLTQRVTIEPGSDSDPEGAREA